MKFNRYIYKILRAAAKKHAESNNALIDQIALMQAINADSSNNDDIIKFYHHMKRIEKSEFVTCTDKNFGFRFSSSGVGLVPSVQYAVT